MNRTVKQLIIYDHMDITSKLSKIFLGVESISLDVGTYVVDLSDAPCETIRKIELDENFCAEGFGVKFSPSELPANVDQFESAVMKFVAKFSNVITGIEIGHESWRNSGAFRLSNSFCEELVNRPSKLVKIEIYNIANHGKFVSFLLENQDQLQLEDVNIHEPNKAGEPKPNKMKIQVD